MAMSDAHQVVATYWAAAEIRDWDTFAALVAEQVVYGLFEVEGARRHGLCLTGK
jgi:hypothetical protein